MNDFEGSYQEIPLRIVIGSFLMVMLFDFMSFPFNVFFQLPKPTVLALLYWVICLPNRIDMGMVSLIGLLVDVGMAASLGLHTLSYIVMVFFVLRYCCQIMLYDHIIQILVVLMLLLRNQTVLVVARFFFNHQIITLRNFIAPVAGALLWSPFSQLIQVIVDFRGICRQCQ